MQRPDAPAAICHICGKRNDEPGEVWCSAGHPLPPDPPAATKRKPVVRLRFCAHPCCHVLVKGVKGAFCIYHETNRG